MKRLILCYLLVATLEIMSLVSVTTSRPFASYAAPDGKDQFHSFPPPVASDSKQEFNQSRAATVSRTEETYKVLGRLGSTPPSCEHKCEGCVPCVAIQIPATSDRLGVQYANYEPEGWKCKCGSAFFNP